MPLTDYGDHPRDDVGKRADPNDAHDKSQREPFLESRLLAVRDREEKNQVYRPRHNPGSLRSSRNKIVRPCW